MTDSRERDIQIQLARFLENLDQRSDSASEPADEASLLAADQEYMETADDLDDEEAARFRQAQACLNVINRVRQREQSDYGSDHSTIRDAVPTKEHGERPGQQRSDPNELDTIIFRDGIPEKIGRFEILRELGRGGFGVVLLAHDPKLNRSVALKIPRAESLINQEARQRFEREAHSAAILSHPAIVPIFEAGSVGAISYIAFEFCDGPSLAHWFSEKDRQISWQVAVKIVSQLAAAIGHAHHRGVVHRDLKPANVLLSPATDDSAQYDDDADKRPFDPSDEVHFLLPRITDFGLAKLESTDATNLTRTGAMIGTPAYMSPEQARGGTDDIGPQADIYSLGAILYELVTGKPPIKKDSDLATLRAIESQDPVPPRRLNRDLPRDLEAVCLKCLNKEPDRRYASALDLESDLNRLLNGQPVEARRSNSIERTWRWCQRKPMSAALLATLVVSFLLVSGLWIRADRLRRVAERERQEASANLLAANENLRLARSTLDDFAKKVSEDLRLQKADLRPLRKQLLEQVVPFYEDLIERYADIPELQYERGQAYIQLGKITEEIGSQQKAIDLFESALQIFDNLVVENPGNLDYVAALSETLNRVAFLYQKSGRMTEADECNGRAIGLLQVLTKENPDELEYHRKLAESYNDRGHRFLKDGEHQKARENFQSAIAARELLLQKSQNSKDQLALAGIHINLGNIHLARRQYKDVEKEYLLAREILEQMVQKYPNEANPRYVLSMTLLNLGEFFKRQRRFSEAESCYLQALEATEALTQQHPSVTKFQEALALVLHNLGDSQGNQRRDQQAEKYLLRARHVTRTLVKQQPSNLQYQFNLAITNEWLAGLFRRSGRMDLAEKTYSETADLFQHLINTQRRRIDLDTRFLNTKTNQLRCLFDLSRFDQANNGIKEIVKHIENRASVHPGTNRFELHLAGMHEQLGIVCYDLQQAKESLRHLETANQMLDRLASKQESQDSNVSMAQASVYYRIGRSLGANGQPDQAITSFDQVVEMTDACRNHHRFLEIWTKTYWERGLANSRLQQFDQSLKDFEQALAIDRGAHRNMLKAIRCIVVAKQGDHRQATKEVSDIARQEDVDGKALYQLGCAVGQSLIAAAVDERLLSGERETILNDYESQAINLFRRADRKGYFNTPEKIDSMLELDELSELLRRNKFKSFLDELRTKHAVKRSMHYP